MATTYLSPYSSALSRSPATDSARPRPDRQNGATPRLLALTQLAGLTGAVGFLGIFLFFASASLSGPLAQAVLLAVSLSPLAVLGYFMRQAWSNLTGRPRERRRSPERDEGLVIDV